MQRIAYWLVLLFTAVWLVALYLSYRLLGMDFFGHQRELPAATKKRAQGPTV